MVLQALHRSVDAESGPELREYGSLFIVLLASRLLGKLVIDGFEATRELLSDTLAPQLVGAVVYAALGLTVLGAAYAARRRLRPTRTAPERHELFTLAGATAMLLLFGAYLLHGAVDLPAFPGDVVGSLLAGGVTAGAGLLYASSRGIDLRIGTPKRDALPAAGLTILIAALAGVGWVVALEVGGNPVFRPTFVGVFAPEPHAPPTVVRATVVVFLAVLAAMLAIRATRILQQRRDAVATPIAAASASALLVSLALIVTSAFRWYPPGFVASGVSYAVVGAAACVGYERSRSVWAPALAFAAYLFVVDPDVALHVSRALL